MTNQKPAQRHLVQQSLDGLRQKLIMTDPDMGSWSYTYDGRGYDREEENSLTVSGVTGGGAVVSEVTYNERGQLRVIDRSHLQETTFTYYGQTGTNGNSNYRLQTIQHDASAALPDYSYTYNVVGNILTLTTAASAATAASDSQLFTCDDLNRLKTAQTTTPTTMAPWAILTIGLSITLAPPGIINMAASPTL